MRRRIMLPVAVALSLAACEMVTTEGATARIPAAIANPSWSRDIAPVLAETCASSGSCHFGPNAQQDLNLEAESSYANTVNVVSQAGPVIVIPGDSVNSFLTRVMSTDIAVRGGYPYRMPLTELPMPEPVIQTIKNWIAQGAMNN